MDSLTSEELRKKLKEEWKLLWRERFDDKSRAEGIAVRDYPLLLTERGYVIIANKDFKGPSFPEVVEFWRRRGLVCPPDPAVGGWGKFIRTHLSQQAHSRAAIIRDERSRRKDKSHQLKKGGRGWLHK